MAISKSYDLEIDFFDDADAEDIEYIETRLREALAELYGDGRMKRFENWSLEEADV